jgi:hypothetical protein
MQKRIFPCLALLGLVLVSACSSSSDSTKVKNALKSTKTTTTIAAATTTTVATSDSTESSASVICGADNGEFPDLTSFAGAGTGYDKATVVVNCGTDTLTVTHNL